MTGKNKKTKYQIEIGQLFLIIHAKHVTGTSRKGKTNYVLSFINHQHDILTAFLCCFYHTIIFYSSN